MAQYLDNNGLNELVKKTKEYARKSAKDAIVKNGQETSGYGPGRTITGWDVTNSAAIYGNIAITSAQVTDLADAMALKADLNSPEFEGTPTVPTPINPTSGSHQIANVEYVLDVIGNIGEAMHYKGVVDQNSDLPTEGYVGGDTYKVATAGTYAGKVCEVGDMIIANKAYAQGAVQNDDWDVIQTNIDGAVTGPAAATSGHFALFDNANGKVIGDAGYGIEHLKTKQSAVSFTSGALQTIDTISQDANGEISVTFQDIPTATTSQEGVVTLAGTLSMGTSEDDTVTTPKAVDQLIQDYFNDAWEGNGTFVGDTTLKVRFTDIESSAAKLNNDIVTASGALDTKIDAVSAAIASSAAALDAKINAVSGVVENLDAEVTSDDDTNVQVKVTQTDGLITAVNITTDNTVNATDVSGIVEGYIDGLDVDAITSTSGAAATITSISEVNGKIAAEYSPISITSAQVTDLGTVLGNYKTVQTAVSDPTADGDGITFIDSASQDTNGVITLHKKTVQSATASQPGLMSASDFTKLGQIATSANYVTIDGNGNLKSTDVNGTEVTLMEPITSGAIDALFA